MDAEREQRHCRALQLPSSGQDGRRRRSKSVWLWAIPAAGAIVCLAWVALLTSYRKLNRAKFTVLTEIEADLPVALFTREREAYRRSRCLAVGGLRDKAEEGLQSARRRRSRLDPGWSAIHQRGRSRDTPQRTASGRRTTERGGVSVVVIVEAK